MLKHLHIFWIGMACLFFWSVQVEASTYRLQTPRPLPEHSVRDQSESLVFSTEGIWERSSGRYLKALPFPSGYQQDLVWKAPWLLSLNRHNQLYQATPEHIFLPINYRHEAALLSDCHPKIFHSGPWVISISELVHIKRIQDRQVKAQSPGLSLYSPVMGLLAEEAAVHLVYTYSQEKILTFDTETLNLQADFTNKLDDSNSHCFSDYSEISNWFESRAVLSDSPYFSAGRLSTGLSTGSEKDEIQWGRDQIFRIHALRKGELAAEFVLPGGEITAWDLDGEYLAIARSNPLQPMLEVWHWPSQKQVRVLNGPQTQVQTLQLQDETLATVTAQDLCSWHWPTEQESPSCQLFKYPHPRIVASKKGFLSLYFPATGQTQTAMLNPHGRVQIQAPVQEQEMTHSESPKSEHTSHMLQLASQKILQHVPGENIRIWRFGQTHAESLRPCQYAPTDWQDCWSELLHWSQERAFVLLYDSMPIDYNPAGSVPNNPRLALVMNLQTGHAEQLVPFPLGSFAERESCLTASHWILGFERESSESIKRLLAMDYQQADASFQQIQTPRHDFDMACAQAQIQADPAAPFAAWQSEESSKWYQQVYQSGTRPLALNGQSLLSVHEYGYLVRTNLQQPDQLELLLPPAELDEYLCQQAQGKLYCLDSQRHWHYLDLVSASLNLKPLLDSAWNEQQDGLLMDKYTNQGGILKRSLRQVLLYASPSGPVWVTDQGHFFRQGEIPAAEMPYLIDGLKSLDLPASLESWPEVQRALQGLPPLRKSGYHIVWSPSE